MLRKAWDWIKKNLWWIKWVGLVVVGLIGYRVIVNKGAKLVDRLVGRHMNWTRVPGSPEVILIRDPETQESEIVLLPHGVKSEDVQSAAKGKMEKYEITIRHIVDDSRAGVGSALDSLGF